MRRRLWSFFFLAPTSAAGQLVVLTKIHDFKKGRPWLNRTSQQGHFCIDGALILEEKFPAASFH
jgi:hypothetical protein